MTIYVVLYQDGYLSTAKVSQEGYKTLAEAQRYCKKALGVKSWLDNPAIYCRGANGQFVFGNAATKQQYTIVEVIVK